MFSSRRYVWDNYSSITGTLSLVSSGIFKPLRYVKDTFIEECPIAFCSLVILPVLLYISIAPVCLNKYSVCVLVQSDCLIFTLRAIYRDVGSNKENEMKILQIKGYGDIKSNLTFSEIKKPSISDNQVLI